MILLNLLISRLAGTILIESFFAYVLGIRETKDFLNIVLVNLMTNPFLVMFSFMMKAKFGNSVYYVILLLMEMLAVFLEGEIKTGIPVGHLGTQSRDLP